MAVDRVELSADDPDTAFDLLDRVFRPERPFASEFSRQPMRLSLRATRAGELRSARFGWRDLACRAVSQPFDDFTAGVLLGGHIRWSAGDEQAALGRDDVVRYSTTTTNDTSWTSYDIATLSVPLTLLEHVAETHTGLSAGGLRFAGITPVSASAARRWRTLTAFVQQSLDPAESTLDSPLLQTQLTELVAATALAVFPNTTVVTGRRSGPERVTPPALRRAVAFIDTHAAEPVTLADIAAAAGTTGRAVQAAFRRHYDTTPLSYLRRVRLEAAHQELRSADPAQSTVAAIAARWGFGPAARFNSFYRQRYGTSPSDTLRG